MANKQRAALVLGLGVFLIMGMSKTPGTAGTSGSAKGAGSAKGGGTSSGKAPGGTSSGKAPGGTTTVTEKPGRAIPGEPDALQILFERTLYGEAGGEGQQGMEYVAAVILNRARIGGWWGSTVQAVIQYPNQFEVWNLGNPAGARAVQMTANPNTAYLQAREITRRALAGQLTETAQGATHYFNPDVVNPSWASSPQMRFLFTWGHHRFFREVTTA